MSELKLPPNTRLKTIVEVKEENITREETNIEAAFGLFKAKTSVSLEQMEQATRKRAIS